MGFELRTSNVRSISNLGPGRAVFMNKGDFHADGDTILLFLPGVSSNLELEEYKREMKKNSYQDLRL